LGTALAMPASVVKGKASPVQVGTHRNSLEGQKIPNGSSFMKKPEGISVSKKGVVVWNGEAKEPLIIPLFTLCVFFGLQTSPFAGKSLPYAWG